ncbi:hypothetical protein FVD58_13475, partial [Enterococcus faecium]|nr:hypothetical protein [Enterococcus faecium]
NLSQNVVHSDSDLILHNSSVLIDKEPRFLYKQGTVTNVLSQPLILNKRCSMFEYLNGYQFSF